VRLTRHAKNRLRLYSLSADEIDRLLISGTALPLDENGNRRVLGTVADGREFMLVIALDNPDLVITLIERSR